MFIQIRKRPFISKHFPSFFPTFFPFLVFLLLLPPIEQIKKLSTPRAPSLDKNMTIGIERKERSGVCNNSDHRHRTRGRRPLKKRLYIEVKCEQACSLVMLAEPSRYRQRQSCTYSHALPKAVYHKCSMTIMISLCAGEASVGQWPTTSERLDGGV